MGMIVLPYMGAAAARRELARPVPAGSVGDPDRPTVAGGAVGDPLQGVSMRLTYRTARVLEGIAERPGASNREAAECAGIQDPGQVSKLWRAWSGSVCSPTRARGMRKVSRTRGFDPAG